MWYKIVIGLTITGGLVGIGAYSCTKSIKQADQMKLLEDNIDLYDSTRQKVLNSTNNLQKELYINCLDNVFSKQLSRSSFNKAIESYRENNNIKNDVNTYINNAINVDNEYSKNIKTLNERFISKINWNTKATNNLGFSILYSILSGAFGILFTWVATKSYSFNEFMENFESSITFECWLRFRDVF